MTKRVNVKRFNTLIPNCQSYFQSFDGAISKELNHYVEHQLKNDKQDLAIIHVGTNDLSPRPQKPALSDAEIVSEIEQIGVKCKSSGIRDIIISSIITRRDVDVESRRCHVNSLVKSMCEKNNFIFLSNENILRSHLWKDGLHLSNRGLCVLADNFINVINSSQ